MKQGVVAGEIARLEELSIRLAMADHVDVADALSASYIVWEWARQLKDLPVDQAWRLALGPPADEGGAREAMEMEQREAKALIRQGCSPKTAIAVLLYEAEIEALEEEEGLI